MTKVSFPATTQSQDIVQLHEFIDVLEELYGRLCVNTALQTLRKEDSWNTRLSCDGNLINKEHQQTLEGRVQEIKGTSVISRSNCLKKGEFFLKLLSNFSPRAYCASHRYSHTSRC